MGRWDNLRRILSLDPERDHQEIYRLSAGFEFPWDFQRSLEFALFRTYSVPSISTLLAATREFELRPQRRYDDTALLMAEMMEHGYDSPRGKAALRSVNRAHGRFRISNEDMLYVLSTFVFEPVRWLDRFGWRRLSDHERLAGFHFYRAVGTRMGIRSIPSSYAEFEQFNVDYERTNFVYTDTNAAVGRYTLELFCSWYPAALRPAIRPALRSLMDRPLLDAFGFAPAPPWLTRLSEAGVRLRSAVVRELPPRRHSKLANDPGNRTYPGYPTGYDPADLGAGEPPKDIDPSLLRR
ncbi:oxygenase MpaB family protein [Kutzneria sp. 744]|uniref:oxygenase MpaB family protein n=1 Tax=Kutzneria sp. (strain 744) TaxID=345341 RepID=UPI0003EEE166|nr:oxygenase MpaB family protein [Kutzneria sp. 744]EWM11199.1 L-aspartate oxidase [Kutzneria sp. 744]